MKALNDEPKIISMAHTLGVHDGDRVKGIKDFCLRKVRTLLTGAGPIRSIDDLERVVCEKLNLTIIEVWSDDDLLSVIEKYARQEKEPAFGGLRNELTDETFATLIQRKRIYAGQDFRYVAVIDCRSGKGSRRFFSRWHEIAHVLTTVEQLQFPLHRSTKKKDAVEKMMDIIAGDLGFFAPLFKPVLTKECAIEGGLTFAVAEKVRQQFCPSASMEATLRACAFHCSVPVMILQAAKGYKKAEERAIFSEQYELIPSKKPSPQLRVGTVIPNQRARNKGWMIPKNMRVPTASVMTMVMNGIETHQPLLAVENLNWWRSSDGKALQHASIRIEAQKIGDRVWAILRPSLSYN